MSNGNTPLSKLSSRERMLIGMNEIIRHLNNEDTLPAWDMGGVPDGASDDEICQYANEDDSFSYMASLFLAIIKDKDAYSDGLCVGDLPLITDTSRHS